MEIVNNKYLGLEQHTAAPDPYAGMGIADAFSRAAKNESLTVQMYQRAEQALSSEFDTNIKYDEKQKQEDFKELSQGIDPSYIHNLERARSREEMISISADMKKATKEQEYLDSYGIGSFFINLGANLVDVPLLMGTMAVAPVAAPSLLAVGSTTTARRMLLGGSAELLFEGAKDLIGEKDRTAIDYTLGAVFGAGVAGLFKNHALMAEAATRTLKKNLNLDEFAKKAKNAKTQEELQKVREEFYKNIDTNQQRLSSKAAMEILSDKKTSKFAKNPVFDALRSDLAYRTSQSTSKSFSSMADQLFIDATNQANKADTEVLAELASKIEDQIIDRYQLPFHEVVLEYGKAAFNKNFFTNRFSDVSSIVSNIAGEAQMRRNLYGESVEENELFIRTELSKRAGNVNFALGNEDMLANMASKIRKLNAETFTNAHDILTRSGKKGFADGSIPKTDTYMPIMYNRNMAEILQSKGLNYGHFKSFILDSALSKIEKSGLPLSEEQLATAKIRIDQISDNIWKNKNSQNLINQSFDDMFDLEKIFDIKDISNYTEFRSPLDYSFKKTFKSADGQDVELSFMDLVEKDMTNVVSKYSRKMGGTTALEKIKLKEQVTTIDELKQKRLQNLSKNISDVYRTLYTSSNRAALKRLSETMDLKDPEELIKSLEEDFFKRYKDADFMKLIDDAIASAKQDDIFKDIGSKLEQIKRNLVELNKQFDDEGKTKDFLQRVGEIYEGYKKAASTAHKETKQALGKDIPITDENYQKLFLENLEKNSKDVNFDRFNEFVDGLTVKVEEREFGLDNNFNIEKARNQIKREMEDAGATERQIENDLVRFDEMVKELQGLPTSTDPFSAATQVQRIMKNLNIARLLGQTGWTMTAELGSVMFESGIRNFMEFSSFKQMFRQFATGQIDDKLAKEIQLFTGLGANLNRAIGINKYDHEFSFTDLTNANQFDSMLNKIENFSEKATEATLLLGGVKPLTAGFEMIMAKSILQEVMDIASKKSLSKGDYKFLNEIGLSEEMAQKIQAQISKYSKQVEKKWSNGHKVTELNFDKWDDVDAQDMLITAMRRKAHQVVQRSSLGDKIGIVAGKNLFKNTLVGRFFLELKDYMITSYVKQFGRAMERRDAYVLGLISTQMAFLTLGTAMQNYTNFVGNDDKMEKAFEPNNFLRTVIGRMPAASYLPTVIDNTARLATGDTIFNSNRYHSGVQDAFMSMPSVDLAAKVGSIFSMPYKAATGSFGGKEVDSLFGIAPLGNTYGVRTAKEYLRAVAEGQ